MGHPIRRVNAAVVGVLGAALFNPVWNYFGKSRRRLRDRARWAVLLTAWRAPPPVAISALGGILLAVAGP